MLPKRQIQLCVLALSLASLSSVSRAGVWPVESFEESVSKADVIVEGVVSSVESYYELGETNFDPPVRNLIRSNVTVSLESRDGVLKGAGVVGERSEIVFNTVGGEVRGDVLMTTATHYFKAGEQVLLLLRKLDEGEAGATGAEFRVRSGAMDTFVILPDQKVRSHRFDADQHEDLPDLDTIRNLIRNALDDAR